MEGGYFLSCYDWNKIRTEYITGNVSYRKLCEKYDIPFTTLQYRARKEGWTKDKRKHSDKIVTKMVDKVEKEKIDYRSTLYDLAYNVAQQLVDVTRDKTIEELLCIGIKPRDITGAIKDLGDILHVKSEVDLREQEARIKKLQKEVEKNETDEREYGVLILPPIEPIEKSGGDKNE